MNARRSKETNKELYATSLGGQLIWVIYFVKYLRAYLLKVDIEWILLLNLQLDKYIYIGVCIVYENNNLSLTSSVSDGHNYLDYITYNIMHPSSNSQLFILCKNKSFLAVLGKPKKIKKYVPIKTQYFSLIRC